MQDPGMTISDLLSVLHLQQWDMLCSQRWADGQKPEEFLKSPKNWLAAVR